MTVAARVPAAVVVAPIAADTEGMTDLVAPDLLERQEAGVPS